MDVILLALMEIILVKPVLNASVTFIDGSWMATYSIGFVFCEEDLNDLAASSVTVSSFEELVDGLQVKKACNFIK